MNRKYKNSSFLPDGLPTEEDTLKGMIKKLRRSEILIALSFRAGKDKND